MYSTHTRASNIKIKFSTAAAAQEPLKAYSDSADKWVVAINRCQYPIHLMVERAAEEAAKTRLVLQVAWLLCQVGLEGAQAEIATGRIYDHDEEQLGYIDRATGQAHLTLLGHDRARISDTERENNWQDDAPS